jgi:hypothetical protein
MRRTVIAFALTGLLLTACASAVQTPPADRKTPLPRNWYASPTPGESLPAPTPVLSELPPAAQAALIALAGLLEVDSSEIAVQAIQPSQWPDSCLGLGGPDEICAQQVVDGYQVELQAIGALFTYRTDASGANLRMVFPPAADAQPAVLAAQAVLAGQLGLGDPNLASVVQALPVYWLNACLGTAPPGLACAEGIIPGFRILLEAQGARYEFHASQDGRQIIQVEAP